MNSHRLELLIPVRTENPLNGATGNTRLAATIRSRKRAKHRATARFLTLGAMAREGLTRAQLVPCVVRLTRISAGTMDTDGLAASQKGIRDGIADALGVNDGSVFIDWRYAQEKGKPKYHAVRVVIERRATRWDATAQAAGSKTESSESSASGSSP